MDGRIHKFGARLVRSTHATTTAFRLAHTFVRTRDLLVSDYIGKNFSSLVRVL